MVSLKDALPENYNPFNYSSPSEYITGGDPREAFAAELRKHGLKIPPSIRVGHIERVPDSEDKGTEKSGWYIYHEIEDDSRSSYFIGVGVFGSWRGNPERTTWCSKQAHSLSAEERRRYDARIEQARQAQEEEIKAKHKEAEKRALEIWEKAKTGCSKYLERKQIPAINIKSYEDKLVCPIYDDGKLCNLQFISEDGMKRFMSGGKVKGCYGIIEGDASRIYIAEGYATAASVHAATGCLVYIAFNAGNLYEVSAAVKANHSGARIIIAADNDAKNTVNIGKQKAEQAAEALGIEYILPTHGTDFNDMHVDMGLDAVKALLNVKQKVYQQESIPEAANAIAPGILADIAGYYNATSGNKQPGFAVQTALCLCSVMCARVFRTNKNNFTSMYFLNVAKSSTGKEHAKSVIEDILHASGQDKIISGDGYTSAGAVFSGLLEHPRHITMIDEFGRYLEAANKQSNSHQTEANTQLMQAISRCHGIMRPPTYSSMTLSEDKKKEQKKKIINNPALTIMAMTTPGTMFGAIDISSINDGFLNRFVVSVSDAERAPRQHKDFIDVPQRILDWIDAIEERRGGQVETAADKPAFIDLQFTDEAMKAQEDFQWYCVDVANKLEAMNLSEISGRANEMAMRMSLICALARDPWAEEITKDDMDWSISYIKTNLERLISMIKMSVSSSSFEANKKEILKSLRDLGEEGASWAFMQKRTPFSKHKRKDLREILDSLVDAGLAFIEEQKPDGRGRPSIVYKAAE